MTIYPTTNNLREAILADSDTVPPDTPPTDPAIRMIEARQDGSWHFTNAAGETIALFYDMQALARMYAFMNNAIFEGSQPTAEAKGEGDE